VAKVTKINISGLFRNIVQQQLHMSVVASHARHVLLRGLPRGGAEYAILLFEVATDFYYTLGYQSKMECKIEELYVEFQSVAIDAARFETEIHDLSTQHSSFVLGERKELLLVVEGGVVMLSNPNNFVILTPYRWVKFIDYWVDIDEEMKALIHMTRLVSFRAHIDDDYYVTIDSPLCNVDISR